MKRRGLVLVTMVTLLMAFSVFFMATQAAIDQGRYRVRLARQEIQARALARSGLEYARAGWRGQRYRSPDLGGGHFELERRLGRVVSTGRSGRAAHVELGP